MVNPSRKPGADITAPGNRREIMKTIEQPAARQSMQDTEAKGRAANAAAGNAKRGLLFLERVNRGPDRPQSFLGIKRSPRRERRSSVQLGKLRLQDLVQSQRGVR